MAQVAAAEAASFPLNSTSHSQAAGGDVLRSPGAKLPVNDEKQVLVEAHQDVEKHSAATANPLEVYSVFTVGQKKAIILSGSFIGLLSYMSGTIYYPAIDQISRDLGVSAAKINLTVTVYLIMQGLAPVFVADMSERLGRRTAFIFCLVLAILANLGLALQNNYVALLVVRLVQSASSCGTVSQALVGDIIVSQERGKYIAYTAVANILGPSLSPFLGGVLSQYAGWHWIFWFLVIFTTALLIPTALFLPETNRKLVHNGSIPPPPLCKNVSDSIRHRNRSVAGIAVNESLRAKLQQGKSFHLPNPLATLRILGDFESALLLGSLGIAFASYYAVFTDLSNVLHEIYGFNDLDVSLAMLSSAGGCILSSFTTGMLVDANYRRHARKLDLPLSKVYQAELDDFPIERARLEVGLPLMLGAAAAVVGYGWTLRKSVPVAVPIVFLFFQGYGLTATSQILIVLMSDIYPGKFATAGAARNIFVCGFGAAASAAINPMLTAIGRGWAFTILAAMFFFSLAGPVACMKNGVQWRKAKRMNDVDS